MGTYLDMHNLDFSEFLQAVNACKGDVFLETSEGDSLNLKSRLCQMIGLSNILSGAMIPEATIRCTNKDDESILFRFNLYREVPDSDE